MDSGHQQAEFFRASVFTWHNVHDLSLVDDRNAIRECKHFIKIFRDEHDRRALTSLFEQLFADVFRRSDIKTSSGLCRKNDARAARKLTRQNYFLDITAGKVF